MVYNSGAWSYVKDAAVKLLEDVDEFFIRSVFKAHTKTPLEFLHLETGTVPLKFTIASRRLNYIHNILSKPANKLCTGCTKHISRTNPQVTGSVV